MGLMGLLDLGASNILKPGDKWLRNSSNALAHEGPRATSRDERCSHVGSYGGSWKRCQFKSSLVAVGKEALSRRFGRPSFETLWTRHASSLVVVWGFVVFSYISCSETSWWWNSERITKFIYPIISLCAESEGNCSQCFQRSCLFTLAHHISSRVEYFRCLSSQGFRVGCLRL